MAAGAEQVDDDVVAVDVDMKDAVDVVDTDGVMLGFCSLSSGGVGAGRRCFGAMLSMDMAGVRVRDDGGWWCSGRGGGNGGGALLHRGQISKQGN